MSRKRNARAAAPQKKAAPPRVPGWHTWLRLAVVTLLCAIAAALFSPFNTLLPVLMVPAVIGLCAGSWLRRPLWAAVAGFVASLSGCWAVLSVYADASFVNWVQTRMPQYSVQDTTGAIFAFIRAMIAEHPLTVARVGGEGVLVVAVMSLLTAGIAAGVAWWRSGEATASRTAITAWVAVGLLTTCFVYTAWTGTVDFRASIASEPADGSYAYDPVFNVKTYYMMARGIGFYDAYVYAMSKDSRRVGTSGIIDGKITTGSPMMLRQPNAFYLWRIAGWAGVDGILALSIAACAAILVASFGVLRKAAATRALFVPLVLFPGLMLHTVWLNIFFPDWWAALAILGSALLLLGRRYWEAGVLAVLAILFRETAGAWALALTAGAVFLWLRGQREWRAKAIAYIAGMVGAVALFAVHYVSGLPYFVRNENTSSFSLISMLAPNVSATLDWKLMGPTSYLMQPYGLYAFPTAFVLPAASAGFWLSLPTGSIERLVLTVYPLMMLLYLLIIGATSSYWGQIVMPVGLIGAALLFARADRLVIGLVSPAEAADQSDDE